MAALSINWQAVTRVAKPAAVVTGDVADVPEDGEEEAQEAVSPFAGLDKPVVAWVFDPMAPAEEGFDKLEEVVLKSEKVGLAMKAFIAVKITAEDAAADPLLADHGRTLPRFLVIDPVKERIKVLEAKRIKVSSLYGAMKSVANRFYEENLDKLVKTHIKLLNERDQLANEEKVLREKENRLADETGAKAERDRAKIEAEIEELKGEMEELAAQERDMWKLTPEGSAA